MCEYYSIYTIYSIYYNHITYITICTQPKGTSVQFRVPTYLLSYFIFLAQLFLASDRIELATLSDGCLLSQTLQLGHI